MKRYISIILVLALCLSFAACSVKDNTVSADPNVSDGTTSAPLPIPDIGTEEFSKEFTDENGRVVYTVKAMLPKITGNLSDELTNYLNSVFYGIFEDACESAESNIENAAAFMDAQNLQNPWSKVIDFNINLSDGQYFSFTVKDYFSMFGSSEVEPTLTGYVFDLVKGEPCTLLDFSYENHSFDSIKQTIVDEFICKDVASSLFNGATLTDEQKESVRGVFDAGNFYLSETGIGFYFSSNTINPNHFGTFVTHYTWDDIAVVLKRNK